jgi:hypothetical protein
METQQEPQRRAHLVQTFESELHIPKKNHPSCRSSAKVPILVRCGRSLETRESPSRQTAETAERAAGERTAKLGDAAAMEDMRPAIAMVKMATMVPVAERGRP